MGSFKSAPFSTLLLIVVLSMIAIVLIAPQIDLPDTAFQRNSSPLAIHAQSHHIPGRNATAGDFSSSLPVTVSFDLIPMICNRDSAVEVFPAPHPILRC